MVEAHRRAADAGPQRVQLSRGRDGRTIVPARSIRVDRISRWWPPFDIDHPYIAKTRATYVDDRRHQLWLLGRMYRQWITGELVNSSNWWLLVDEEVRHQLRVPPGEQEIQFALRGKNLADWPPIGWPCIGDVLLSIANRTPDGALYPTASDNFKPRHRTVAKRPGESWKYGA